jgi:hypothetical protein
MFGDDVAASFDIGAHKQGVELAGETGGLP